MKIKSVAPWFGSKRTLAPEIVIELGKHSAFWDPFCGSLAVLFAKPISSHETVNDLHGDVINLARVVADPELGPDLYGRASRILACEAMLAEYDEKIRHDEYDSDELNVERALAYFISSWLGRNGFSGLKKSERGQKVAVRWTPSGGHGGQRFASAVESIPDWHYRLKRPLVLDRRDGMEMLARIDDHPRVAIYIDPPYLVKSDQYVHDFESNEGSMFGDDHQRLSDALHRFKKARVVVSYYDHPRLARLYPGWTKRTFDVAKTTGRGRGETGKRAIEVLLMNGPSYAQ